MIARLLGRRLVGSDALRWVSEDFTLCDARMVKSADTADLKSYKFMDILAINIR
jgi:hypothetical protein